MFRKNACVVMHAILLALQLCISGSDNGESIVNGEAFAGYRVPSGEWVPLVARRRLGENPLSGAPFFWEHLLLRTSNMSALQVLRSSACVLSADAAGGLFIAVVIKDDSEGNCSQVLDEWNRHELLRGVYTMPASAKVARELNSASIESESQPLDSGILVILATLVQGDDEQSTDLIQGWKASLEECITGADVASSRKIAVYANTSDGCVDKVVSFLASQNAVKWVEPKPLFKTKLKYATSVLQGGSWRDWKRPIWDAGFKGSGEIIGVGDTGLDHDNCFFRDEQKPPPICRQVNREECQISDTGHRKIVGYRILPGAEEGDAESGGHGTPVAGAIAGNAISNVDEEINFAKSFNGVAPNARLVVDDMSDESEYDMLRVPNDLYEGLFPFSYQLGARIYSNAWGDSSTEYTSSAEEVDRYMYNHNDFLVLFAAGNSGQAAYTVESPATAKNILSVGASGNSLYAYWDYYANNGLALSNLNRYAKIEGGPGDSVGMFIPLIPAEFGPKLTQDSERIWGSVVASDPLNACSNVSKTVNMTGRIALVSRGDCTFVVKVQNAQQAGAIAVLVYNNVLQERTPVMSATGPVSISIPSFSMSARAGQVLNDWVARGSVQISLLHVYVDDPPKEQLAWYSSRGPARGQRFKPDVVCAGSFLRTASSDGDVTSGLCVADMDEVGSSVKDEIGTSFAVSVCAGAAALVRQFLRVRRGMSPSAALVKAVMLHSGRAVYYNDTSSGTLVMPPSMPHFSQGYGMVDLSLVLVNASARPQPSTEESIISEGSVVLHYFFVEAFSSVPTAQLRVTIAWTDPPASVGSAYPLMNDLDLSVAGPQNTFYFGNNLTTGYSVPGQDKNTFGLRDESNINEQVTISEPLSGNYVVRITASRITSTQQRYALVVTGATKSTNADVPQNVALACYLGCSGRGQCVKGTCMCSPGYAGHGCEAAVVQIPEKGGSVVLTIDANGWAYVSWGVPKDSKVQLTVRSGRFGSAEGYLRVGGALPSMMNHEWSTDSLQGGSGDILVRDPASVGRWTLGVIALCCSSAEVTVDIQTVPSTAPFAPATTSINPLPKTTPQPSIPDFPDVGALSYLFVVHMDMLPETFKSYSVAFRQAVAAVAAVPVSYVEIQRMDTVKPQRRLQQKSTLVKQLLHLQAGHETDDTERIMHASEDTMVDSRSQQALGDDSQKLAMSTTSSRRGSMVLEVETSVRTTRKLWKSLASNITTESLSKELLVRGLPRAVLINEGKLVLPPANDNGASVGEQMGNIGINTEGRDTSFQWASINWTEVGSIAGAGLILVAAAMLAGLYRRHFVRRRALMNQLDPQTAVVARDVTFRPAPAPSAPMGDTLAGIEMAELDTRSGQASSGSHLPAVVVRRGVLLDSVPPNTSVSPQAVPMEVVPQVSAVRTPSVERTASTLGEDAAEWQPHDHLLEVAEMDSPTWQPHGHLLLERGTRSNPV